MFPPNILDLIDEDHICRLVDEVVESIDLGNIEEKYDGPGSPAYHPNVMMKLLIEGTIDGIRSSRKISKATKENVVYMYLSDRLNPDFRTICRFRKDNLETIKFVFAEIIRLARGMDMVKLGHLSIDGTKIKASASNYSVLSKEELDEIKEAIDMELQKGIEIDAMEDEIYGDVNSDKLPKPFKDVKESIRKSKAAKITDQYRKGNQQERSRIKKQLDKVQNEFVKSEKDFVSFTDPESRFMPNKKHFTEFSYNPQVTVDLRSKTVERVFGHIKQNIGLREFLTRGLEGVRAEFSLACIAHNLKRIWKIKGQIRTGVANF